MLGSREILARVDELFQSADAGFHRSTALSFSSLRVQDSPQTLEVEMDSRAFVSLSMYKDVHNSLLVSRPPAFLSSSRQLYVGCKFHVIFIATILAHVRSSVLPF